MVRELCSLWKPQTNSCLSTAGWILYRTDPTEGSNFCKAQWQCAGNLPEGYVPEVWWSGRSGDPSSSPHSQAPGPGPCALHQHSGCQGDCQEPPPHLCHGQYHPCPAWHQRWGSLVSCLVSGRDYICKCPIGLSQGNRGHDSLPKFLRPGVFLNLKFLNFREKLRYMQGILCYW